MSEHYKTGGVLRFRGKSYTLFQRGDKSGASYSVRVQIEGKRKLVSTGTGDLTLAKAAAKTILSEILDGRAIVPRKVNKKVSTVGDVIDAFKAGDRYVRARTGREYELALLRMIQSLKGIDANGARAERLNILTEDFVRAYQAKRQGFDSVDYVTPRKVNTAINSTIRQAKGIFSRKALATYSRVGLIIPESLQGFLRTGKLRELSHKYSEKPIPKEQIDKLNADLPALKEEDVRLWAIHLIIRLMGLRNSEIGRAKKDWLIKRGEKSFLVINRREGEAAPKRSDGEVPVPQVLLDYFSSHDDEYLIPARTKFERETLIYITHSKWVKARVPGRTKTNHELRKWAGSMVATKTNSWERAAEFLRIDLETAKNHYLSFVTPADALSLEDLEG